MAGIVRHQSVIHFSILASLSLSLSSPSPPCSSSISGLVGDYFSGLLEARGCGLQWKEYITRSEFGLVNYSMERRDKRKLVNSSLGL